MPWKKIRRVKRRMGLPGKRDQGGPKDKYSLYWLSRGEVLGIFNRQEVNVSGSKTGRPR